MNYSASERECLVVTWELKKLSPYPLYEPFVVHTDHTALHWLLIIDDPSGHLMRWRLRLAEYDFEVGYKKGKANTQADALSRLVTDRETIPDNNDDIQTFLIDEEPDKDYSFSYLLHMESDHDDFMEPEYNDGDISIAAMDDPTPHTSHLEPISIDEHLKEQLTDTFCTDIRRRLNKGRD